MRGGLFGFRVPLHHLLTGVYMVSTIGIQNARTLVYFSYDRKACIRKKD